MHNLSAVLTENRIVHKFDYPLAPHTGFRTGGSALLALFPTSAAQLKDCVALLNAQAAPYAVLGKGCNTLVADSGVDLAVIFTRGISAVNVEGDVITADAGASLARVCRVAALSELSGFESLFGIPASVGGAVYMNAGAYGAEISDCFLSCRVLTPLGETKTLSREDMCFSYRASILQTNGCILLDARFRLKPGSRAAINERMIAVTRKRREKQPLELPSCGSAFKRPTGAFAAELIDRCGLKGLSVGGAVVSVKHAGFIVNGGGATSSDIMALLRLVRDTVFEKTGYTLEPEIRFFGYDIWK